MPQRDSGPPLPVAIELEPDAPAPALDISFDDEEITEPEPRPRRSAAQWASGWSRLFAWTVDGALVGAFAGAHLVLAMQVVPTAYLLEAVRAQLPCWLALASALAVAYSWLFAALGARTPGMALAGQRLQTLQGDAPSVSQALVRAVLSQLSAALCFFGFILALFDARGQTLHDKLCRCVVIVSPPDA
ncbi:MAG: RDD family protein [Deltaproteobacteria bacterium]|nr:MAG: RDD family protein [Deltaproteobacteria bacterium]